MPTYDYKCLNCGHSFELFQSMSAEPVTKCYKCNGKLKRLIGTGAGPIFKGSGFYQTDYKKSTSKSETKSDSTKKDETKETPNTKKDNIKDKDK
jgi:putative FmdB family regulatory protein